MALESILDNYFDEKTDVVCILFFFVVTASYKIEGLVTAKAFEDLAKILQLLFALV